MKIIGIVLIVLVVGIIGYLTLQQSQNSTLASVTNYDECIAAGYPSRDIYPPQCATPDGQVYTQDIGNEMEYIDLIRVDNPRPNQKITSPTTVSGSARGNWYFEANFPVELRDDSGNLIADGFATAQGEWMTEEFVPFEAQIEFTRPVSGKGVLILKNANASGLPENDKEVRMPVVLE